MIFCDLDGVLVDFDNHFKNKYGVFTHEISRKELWEKVLSVPNYWADIPPTQDAKYLLDYIKQYDYKILTGLPTIGYDKANIEKRLWVEKHLGKHIEVICCLSKDKQKFGTKGDILIDDRVENIKKWQSMGGVGVIHKDAKSTIANLMLMENIDEYK